MDSPLLTLLGRPGRFLTLTATTTGASETVSIARLTTDVTSFIDWGDGVRDTLVAGVETARTHVYASAGTYNIRVHRAERITQIDIRNAKFSALNTNQLRRSRISYFYLSGLTAANIVINSADMVGWGVSSTFTLSDLPSAGITLDSADMVGWGVSSQFYLRNLPSAGITLDSADMVGWGVSSTFYLYNLPSAGITLDSADMVGWGVSSTFTLINLPSAGITLDSADMVAWNSPDEIRINNCGLTAPNLTQAILGAWGIRNLMGHDTPVLNVGGASNAVPSGAYAEENPPSTDLGYIYELVNDTEAEGFYRWAILWNGGSAP